MANKNSQNQEDLGAIERQVVHMNDPALSPEERWSHDTEVVQKLALYDTATRNLFLWTAGCMLTTLQEHPENYGKTEDEVPSQGQFGRKYMAGASRATVQRALKLYEAYDQSFLRSKRRLTQKHLLKGVEVPEERRESILQEVEDGLETGDMDTTDGVKRIEAALPRTEEGEDQSQGQDQDQPEHPTGEDPVEEPTPEGDGGPEPLDGDVSPMTPDRPEHTDGGSPNGNGSLTPVQSSLMNAYKALRDYDDLFEPQHQLTPKEKMLVKEIKESCQEMIDIANGLLEVGK